MQKTIFDKLTSNKNKHNSNPNVFPVISISGPPYERGLQYGHQARKRIELTIACISNIITLCKFDWNSVRYEINEFKDIIKSYNSDYFEEMRGIAKGARVEVEAIILINARSEIFNCLNTDAIINPMFDDGCTNVAALNNITQDGQILMGQNWDWLASFLNTGVIVNIKQRPDSSNIIALVEAGAIARNGINDAGIAVGANTMHSSLDNQNTRGVPMSVLRRAALDKDTYRDAIAAILQAPSKAGSSNIMIAAAEGCQGEALCIESTPLADYCVLPINDLLIHANHFVNLTALTELKDTNINAAPSTLYRPRRVESLLTPYIPNITMDNIKTSLLDKFGKPFSVCRCNTRNNSYSLDESITLSIITYNLTNKTMEVCANPNNNNEFIKYSFDDFS